MARESASRCIEAHVAQTAVILIHAYLSIYDILILLLIMFSGAILDKNLHFWFKLYKIPPFQRPTLKIRPAILLCNIQQQAGTNVERSRTYLFIKTFSLPS